MAEITKDSFDAADNHSLVVIQKGREVADYELVELQKVLRNNIRKGAHGDYANYPLRLHEATSNAFKVVASGASNSVSINGGYASAYGDIIYKASSTTHTSGLATPAIGVPQWDAIYVAVVETEIDDPNFITNVGVLSRRKVLSISFGTVMSTVSAAAAVTAVGALCSVADITDGGTQCFVLAMIYRPGNQAAINAADVTDYRRKIPLLWLKELVIDGTPSIRKMEVAPTNANDYHTILSAHNARFGVTVGNGTTSFGDFSTINAAVDWIIANSVTKAVLFVKAGTYSLTAQCQIPANTQLRIVGENAHPSSSTTLIQHGSATASMFELARNATLILENIDLYSSSASVDVISYTTASTGNGCNLIVSNSRIRGGVQLFCPRIVRIKDSILQNNLCTYTLRAVFSSGSNGSEEFVVENSALTITTTDQAAIRIDSTTSTDIDTIRLTNTKFDLSASVTAVSGGLPAGVCGILAIVPVASATVMEIAIQRVIIEGCRATLATGAVSGITGCWLHLTEGHPGLTHASGGGRITYAQEVSIRNNVWNLNDADFRMKPFAVLLRDSVGKVVLENNSFINDGVSCTTWGEPLSPWGYYYGAGTSGWASPTPEETGALMISGPDVAIRNTRLVNFSSQADSGDAWFASDGKLVVDGLFSVDGGTFWESTVAACDARLKIGCQTFNNGFGQQAVISGVTYGSSVYTAVGDGIRVVNGINTSFKTQLTIKDCCLHDVGAHGVHFFPRAASSDDFGGVHVENVSVTSATGSGIRFVAGTAGQLFGPAKILRNNIVSAGAYGIHIADTASTAVPDWKAIHINDNYITGCTDEGIYISAILGDNTGKIAPPIVLSNNVVHTNDGGPANTQIYVKNSYSAGVAVGPALTAFGNNCADPTDRTVVGLFRIARDGSPAVSLNDSASTTTTPVRGCETGYVSTGTAPTRRFVTGDPMLHNLAILNY